MPASGIRCTAIINEDVFGMSDTFVYASEDFTATKIRFLQLFKLRMALCGAPCVAFRGRMSKIGSKRVVSILSSDDISNMPVGAGSFGTPSGTNADGTADQPKSSMQVRCQDNAGRTKTVYLSGIPDVVIGESPRGPRLQLVPGFAAAFNVWAQELTSQQWGWIGRVTNQAVTMPQNVIDVIKDTVTGNIGMIIGNIALGNAPPNGVMARNFKMTSRQIYQANGRWTVQSVQQNYPVAGQYTYWLRDSANVNPLNIVRTGTLELVDFEWIKISSVDPVRQTTRARGNRFLTPPGRRSSRRKVLV